MAQATNPGTTGEGTQPQDAGANAGGTGQQQAGQPKRLIAGKYENLEDAVENGIIGLERAFHQTREDLAKTNRMLELALSGGTSNQQDPRTVPVGTAGGGYQRGDQYGRGRTQQQMDEDRIDPTMWLTNPEAVLQQRDQKLMRTVAGVVENVVANAMVVGDFKRQNPDLVPHERIVRAFMNETDPTKPYGDRLTDAAGMTRKYLTELRAANGGNTNPAPSGTNYTEPPRGGGFGPGGGGPTVPGGLPPQQLGEEEKELMDYINERNQDISARFGIKS